jgi:tRNA pseudouridine55 synthase
MNGVLVIDKPAGLTSHDVVSRVRRIAGERAVGHLGTLDPAATGVLPLVLGKLTRLAQFYLRAEKDYEGRIRFGFATDTYDAAGEPMGEPRPVTFSLEELGAAAASFRGVIRQMPPPFSAKKIAGVPAYKLARKKKDVELRPVEVEVKQFELLALEGEYARFKASVASGTYLRSIAHDLGAAMGTGAHLAGLQRTRVAEFTLAEAHTLEQAAAAAQEGRLEDVMVHPRTLLPWMPGVTADEETAGKIRHGRAVNLPEMSRAPQVKVFYGQRELICIARRVAGTLFQPAVVLAG